MPVFVLHRFFLMGQKSMLAKLWGYWSDIKWYILLTWDRLGSTETPKKNVWNCLLTYGLGVKIPTVFLNCYFSLVGTVLSTDDSPASLQSANFILMVRQCGQNRHPYLFYQATCTWKYIHLIMPTYIFWKNISFYIYIIVCVYRGYLYISNIEYIEFGYFRELYFKLHLFEILRYLAYLFGCDCFDSSLFVFTMNTLPPLHNPSLGHFCLDFESHWGGPWRWWRRPLKNCWMLLGAPSVSKSWRYGASEGCRVNVWRKPPLPPLTGKKQHAGIWTWWVPSSETVLYPEDHRVQIPAAGVWGCIVWCLSIFVLSSISLLGESIIPLVLRTVSMIILRASGEPMLLNNNCWTTTICIHCVHICYGWLL